jgi:GH25 family lysozyme M1 (1,4-beta-N-acetylmuramidase)
LEERNWRETKSRGYLRGAYHYYRPNEKSTLQFEKFSSEVKLEEGDLPPVLDVEEIGRYGSENLRNGVLNWLALAEQHYGVKPIIYTGSFNCLQRPRPKNQSLNELDKMLNDALTIKEYYESAEDLRKNKDLPGAAEFYKLCWQTFDQSDSTMFPVEFVNMADKAKERYTEITGRHLGADGYDDIVMEQ